MLLRKFKRWLGLKSYHEKAARIMLEMALQGEWVMRELDRVNGSTAYTISLRARIIENKFAMTQKIKKHQFGSHEAYWLPDLRVSLADPKLVKKIARSLDDTEDHILTNQY